MSNWNLPPGCTDRMVDEAFGYSSGKRGVYTVTVERTITATVTVEVEADSKDDAFWDAVLEARKVPFDNWKIDQDDYETTNVEAPDTEPDPDEERDARADYEFDRDR